jgi:hypothetical protein
MIIAEAVVARKPIATVARQLGVTRSWASREAHAAETGDLIGQLLLGHKDRLEALFTSALGAMDVLLDAQAILYAGGKPVGLVPDQRTRLKAVGLYTKMLNIISTIQTSRSAAPHESVRLLRVLISIADLQAQFEGREMRKFCAAEARARGEKLLRTRSGARRSERRGGGHC